MTGAVVRQATLSDLRTMLDWAAGEGWNPGREDAAAFYDADPEGFFVSETGGEPVACISVVNHSDTFAFLGFYICRPDHRGRGIGLALWRHALAHAGGRTVGLDGVASQQANYERSGFLKTGASVRFEGHLPPEEDRSIRDASDADVAQIERLDLAANGVRRPRFLARWTSRCETRRTVVDDGPDGTTGFATVRRCREGVKIGPIVAASPQRALVLARACVARLPSSRVIIDVPSANSGLIGSLKRLSFVETFATARMYRGRAPDTGAELQAIATMELG